METPPETEVETTTGNRQCMDSTTNEGESDPCKRLNFSDVEICSEVHACSLAKREIQMLEVFRKNLLQLHGSPPKTQTLRDWGLQRQLEHFRSFKKGMWIRVWRGQGHSSTIGWLRIVSWDKIRIRDITQADCIREGRPSLTPFEFIEDFFPKYDDLFILTRIQFVFRACIHAV